MSESLYDECDNVDRGLNPDGSEPVADRPEIEEARRIAEQILAAVHATTYPEDATLARAFLDLLGKQKALREALSWALDCLETERVDPLYSKRHYKLREVGLVKAHAALQGEEA